MIETNETTNAKEDKITLSQAASLLWEEWKYRHDAFWSSVYRWGMATVAVSIAPYLLPDLIQKLGLAVMIFPVLAFLLALFATWHLASEYIRLVAITPKYRMVLGEFAPDKIPDSELLNPILKLPIGKVVTFTFLFLAIVVEFFNTLILLWLVFHK